MLTLNAQQANPFNVFISCFQCNVCAVCCAYIVFMFLVNESDTQFGVLWHDNFINDDYNILAGAVQRAYTHTISGLCECFCTISFVQFLFAPPTGWLSFFCSNWWLIVYCHLCLCAYSFTKNFIFVLFYTDNDWRMPLMDRFGGLCDSLNDTFSQRASQRRVNEMLILKLKWKQWDEKWHPLKSSLHTAGRVHQSNGVSINIAQSTPNANYQLHIIKIGGSDGNGLYHQLTSLVHRGAPRTELSFLIIAHYSRKYSNYNAI